MLSRCVCACVYKLSASAANFIARRLIVLTATAFHRPGSEVKWQGTHYQSTGSCAVFLYEVTASRTELAWGHGTVEFPYI